MTAAPFLKCLLIFGLPAAPKTLNRMIPPLIRELSWEDFLCSASKQKIKYILPTWLAVRGKSVKNNEKKRQREALRVSLQGERLSKRPLLRGSF